VYTTCRLSFIIGFILLTTFLSGCTGNRNTSIPSSAPAATTTPQSEVKPELEKYFQGFTGTFVLYDLNRKQYIRYNPARSAERFLPASTFKILNSLIGLETGVIPDENYVIKWDGTHYDVPAWNQDHTLKTAIQNSVVWYYQELARRVGKEKMQHYVDVANYGNKDISGKIDSFWLDGGLRISANEQVEFLKRLYDNELSFSQRSMKIVKEIIVLEKAEEYQLSGKTGSAERAGTQIGWFIGYVEEKGDVYFFATNIEDQKLDASGVKAQEISKNILQGLGLLP
jgi:beta-lactamase class D